VTAPAAGFEFDPLVRTPRRRAVARALIGPVIWLVAILVAAVIVKRTDAIEVGVLLAVGTFLLSTLVLVAVRAARVREERRYAQRR
jgi:hypothetical protein